MMKSPEEIKKGLELCGKDPWCAGSECPYYEIDGCHTELAKDAYTLNQQLEARINVLVPQAALFEEAIAAGEKYKRERDAAVEDLKELSICEMCKHYDGDINCEVCAVSGCDWQWRGAQEVE